MDVNWLEVASQLITLLAPVVITVAVPLLAVAARRLMARATEFYLTETTEAQRLLVEKLVHDAVLFAEQQGYVAAAKNELLDKKKAALDWLQAAFATHGLRVDVAYISGLIEAAVLAETRKGTINVEKGLAASEVCADCPKK